MPATMPHDPRDDYATASTSEETETETESEPEADSEAAALAHARAMADGIANVYPTLCAHGYTEGKWGAVLCDGTD